MQNHRARLQAELQAAVKSFGTPTSRIRRNSFSSPSSSSSSATHQQSSSFSPASSTKNNNGAVIAAVAAAAAVAASPNSGSNSPRLVITPIPFASQLQIQDQATNENNNNYDDYTDINNNTAFSAPSSTTESSAATTPTASSSPFHQRTQVSSYARSSNTTPLTSEQELYSMINEDDVSHYSHLYPRLHRYLIRDILAETTSQFNSSTLSSSSSNSNAFDREIRTKLERMSLWGNILSSFVQQQQTSSSSSSSSSPLRNSSSSVAAATSAAVAPTVPTSVSSPLRENSSSTNQSQHNNNTNTTTTTAATTTTTPITPQQPETDRDRARQLQARHWFQNTRSARNEFRSLLQEVTQAAPRFALDENWVNPYQQRRQERFAQRRADLERFCEMFPNVPRNDVSFIIRDELSDVIRSERLMLISQMLEEQEQERQNEEQEQEQQRTNSSSAAAATSAALSSSTTNNAEKEQQPHCYAENCVVCVELKRVSSSSQQNKQEINLCNIHQHQLLPIQQQECVVCLSAARTHAFMSCGHRCVCGSALCKNLPKCPICNTENVLGTLRIFD